MDGPTGAGFQSGRIIRCGRSSDTKATWSQRHRDASSSIRYSKKNWWHFFLIDLNLLNQKPGQRTSLCVVGWRMCSENALRSSPRITLYSSLSCHYDDCRSLSSSFAFFSLTLRSAKVFLSTTKFPNDTRRNKRSKRDASQIRPEVSCNQMIAFSSHSTAGLRFHLLLTSFLWAEFGTSVATFLSQRRCVIVLLINSHPNYAVHALTYS